MKIYYVQQIDSEPHHRKMMLAQFNGIDTVYFGLTTEPWNLWNIVVVWRLKSIK